MTGQVGHVVAVRGLAEMLQLFQESFSTKLGEQSSLNGWRSFLVILLKWMIQMEIKGGKYIQKLSA